MQGKIIKAPDYSLIVGPSIFLAGPIQGAADWQAKAIEYLRRECPGLNVSSPRGDYSGKRFDYGAQVDWETHHLNEAAKNGAILFWLAKESEHICERAYAQTTRFELAEWKTKNQYEGVKMVVGIEQGFTGARYIRKRLTEDCPNIPICSSLEETCRQAIVQATKK